MNQYRERLKNKKRIVVKIGSSSLQHPKTGELDYIKLEVLVRELCNLRNQGKDVVLVTSGAIAQGKKAMHLTDADITSQNRIAMKQACAAIGQARLMMTYQRIFSEYNQVAAQVLLTKYTMQNHESVVNAKNTFEELQNLAVTDCKYEVVKRAFLFSCLTGLRWSDVFKLTWKEVRDENDDHRIFFTQQKTDDLEYMYISKQARELLGERNYANPIVFVNLNYGTGTNTEILRWCMKAGITKHITFHCARHTAATLLLEAGADLYTVMKVLGHKDIRTTQIYAKIVDKRLKEASNLLPTLNLEL